MLKQSLIAVHTCADPYLARDLASSCPDYCDFCACCPYCADHIHHLCVLFLVLVHQGLGLEHVFRPATVCHLNTYSA